jgi:putative nucleotidyltransferase with HDIG domain
MSQGYATVETARFVVGEPLPAPLFLLIDGRHIRYKGAGDIIDRLTFDRLHVKGVKVLYVLDADKGLFEKWMGGADIPPGADPEKPIERPTSFQVTRNEARRAAMDLFSGNVGPETVVKTLAVSKKLVMEVMKQPYVSKNLAQLQYFARGTVDHSVNVSVLSVYLAHNMGYTHQLILNHIGTGALLHDIGKVRVPLNDNDTLEESQEKLKAHPELGVKMLDEMPGVPSEVKMIVGQHHELFDGTGFPKKLRGAAIYDLARIVGLANLFDRMVADQTGTLPERQQAVVKKLDQVLHRKFEPQKLEKAVKILRMGV